MSARWVVGNWKLHLGLAETEELCSALTRWLSEEPAWAEQTHIAVAPPFTSLETAQRCLKTSPIALAAQNLHWEDKGAFTGEVSGPMLHETGCKLVIVGHSERRAHFHDSDAAIRKRLEAAWRASLTPILCVGEQLADREAGKAEAVVVGQLTKALEGLSFPASVTPPLLVAYEPVWAIGTGRVATPTEAQAMHRVMREHLMAWKRPESPLPLLYGGSVKPDNAAGLFSQLDIDGGLIGGASLDFEAFSAIVRAAAGAPGSPSQ